MGMPPTGRRRVVTLLVDQKLLARRFARNMLSRRHSGFRFSAPTRAATGPATPIGTFRCSCGCYAEGKFPLDKLVTDRYRLEQIHEACAALRAGDVMGVARQRPLRYIYQV